VATWTNKQWGAVIGGIVIFLLAVYGIGVAALVVLAAIIGYFIGKFLDGEIDVEEVQARAQGRSRGM
jgi:uncharacterized protein YcfJ